MFKRLGRNLTRRERFEDLESNLKWNVSSVSQWRDDDKTWIPRFFLSSFHMVFFPSIPLLLLTHTIYIFTHTHGMKYDAFCFFGWRRERKKTWSWKLWLLLLVSGFLLFSLRLPVSSSSSLRFASFHVLFLPVMPFFPLASQHEAHIHTHNFTIMNDDIFEEERRRKRKATRFSLPVPLICMDYCSFLSLHAWYVCPFFFCTRGNTWKTRDHPPACFPHSRSVCPFGAKKSVYTHTVFACEDF